ncbi:MAG TPA: molybdopterin dinucleotide binding domain-containing protein [bacterium]
MAANKRTLCPLCGYGCELEVVFDDLGVRGVEYPKGSPNSGRLCPRGSASAIYLDHPRRLTQPLKNDRPVTWDRISKDLQKMVAEPEKLAVVFDRNITHEEYSRLVAFCHANSIDQYASAYLESESALSSLIHEQASFSPEQIDKAQVICLVGDVFNQSPMISKEIIAWRLRDRKNRLVVIDSMKTHTAAFATDFLKAKAGTEPLVLLLLALVDLEDQGIEETTGVAAATINGISQLIKNAGSGGLMFASVPFGRSYDDSLWTEGLRLLRDHSGMKLVPLYEFAGYPGGVDFAMIMDRIREKRIKNLLCLGELFPHHYPQLAKELKGVHLVAATPWRVGSCTAMPLALNIEKAGTVTTIFGEKTISGAVLAPSGVRTILELLPLPGNTSPAEKKSAAAPRLAANLKARVGQAVERSRQRKKKSYRLVGEKLAFCFGAFFEPEMLKINPEDAAALRVKDGETVVVESAQSRQSLPAKISHDTDPGVIAVPAETSLTRGLFDYWIDEQTVRFMPTAVKIWRKE